VRTPAIAALPLKNSLRRIEASYSYCSVRTYPSFYFPILFFVSFVHGKDNDSIGYKGGVAATPIGETSSHEFHLFEFPIRHPYLS
jgi:hypothetical protein